MSTRAIKALVKIMQDKEIGASLRIKACEGLLEYEAPQDIVELAKAFLTSIFEDEEKSVTDRLDATKLMRKFEAPRIRQQVIAQRDPVDYIEAQRDLAISIRKGELIRAGLLPNQFPADWADDLRSADWIPPPPGPTQTAAEMFREIDREAAERRRARLKLVKTDQQPQ